MAIEKKELRTATLFEMFIGISSGLIVGLIIYYLVFAFGFKYIR